MAGIDPQKVRRGDPAAVAHIRCAIEAVVCGFGLRESGWGDDLIQEALGRVYIGVVTRRFTGAASLETYASKTAKYTCLEHLRSRRRLRELSAVQPVSTEAGRGAEESLLRIEEYRRSIRHFAELSSECRELLTLLYSEELSYTEIAERTGLTESAIRSRVHRCRVAACKSRQKDVRHRQQSRVAREGTKS